MKPKSNKASSLTEAKPYDCCGTPSYGLDPLLPFLPKDKIIWEPACGRNHISSYLTSLGYRVMAYDIDQGYNFFDYMPMTEEWIQVTNPGYSSTLKFAWIKKSVEIPNPFALLLPVETFGSQKAQACFESSKYGDVQVIWLDHRINFDMPVLGCGGSQFPTCWVTRGLNLPKMMNYGKIIYPPEVIQAQKEARAKQKLKKQLEAIVS